VAEQLSKGNPENAELQAFAAFVYAYKGRVYSTIAGNRVDHWKQAREWLKRGSDILTDLKNRGAWTSSTFGDPNELVREIAVCDANIERLQGRGTTRYPQVGAPSGFPDR
jgi:hypothetical protein